MTSADTRDALQQMHREALQAAGAGRAAALQQADVHLKNIGRLIRAALRAGVRLTEIAEITGVSRPTLYSLQQTVERDPQTTAFDVLTLLAYGGQLDAQQLAAELGLTEDEAAGLLQELTARGLISVALTSYSPATTSAHYRLTPEGDRELEWLTSLLRQQLDRRWAVYVQIDPGERAQLLRVADEAFGSERYAVIEPSLTNITGSVKDIELAFHVLASSPREASQRALAQVSRLRELGGLKARIDRTVLVLADRKP